MYVPKNVANYIELCKNLGLDLIEAYTDKHCKTMFFKGNLEEAIVYAKNNQELFAMAWAIGYKILKPKYKVKIKAVTGSTKYLMHGELSDTWYFGNGESIHMRILHTKEELEDAGFDWVFNCEGIEITEVH